MHVSGADEALAHLMAWASRGKWRERLDGVVTEHLAEVCGRFELTPEALRGALGDLHHANLMGCVVEDFVTRRFGRQDSNVIDDYLDHRAWRESPSGRDYLRSLRASVMSLYEVVDLAPGSHLVLKDLVRGGALVTVDERLGSRSAARWDRLGARVLSIGGNSGLSGGVLHFAIEPAESVLRIFRKSLHAKEAEAPRTVDDDLRGALLTGLLAGTAKVLTRIWLASTLGAIRQSAPHLVNFDGEEIVSATVRFPVAPEQEAQVERALDRAEGLERDPQGPPRWIWRATPDLEPAPPPTEPTDTFVDTFNDGGPRVLGHIVLQAGAVLLQTNSVNRADRGTARLKGILGGLTGESKTSTQSVEQAFDEWRAQQHAPSVTAETVPADVQASLAHPYLERHYRRSLDEPIPMLGDESPRAAVRSADGREKVITWLKYLENMEDRGARDAGRPVFDFTWMWRELGILDLRK